MTQITITPIKMLGSQLDGCGDQNHPKPYMIPMYYETPLELLLNIEHWLPKSLNFMSLG